MMTNNMIAKIQSKVSMSLLLNFCVVPAKVD